MLGVASEEKLEHLSRTPRAPDHSYILNTEDEVLKNELGDRFEIMNSLLEVTKNT